MVHNNIKEIGFLSQLAVIDNVIASCTFLNRQHRRSINKCKDKKLKLAYIYSETDKIKEFVAEVYSRYRGKIKIDDNLSYDEIMKSYTRENAVENTLYLLNKLYNDREFYEEYYERFIESPEFIKTCTNTWGREEEPIKEELPPEPEEKENDMELEYISTEEPQEEEEHTERYMGVVEKVNTFYNFFPDIKIVGTRLERADLEVFPEIGNINLEYVYNTESAKYLEGLLSNRHDRFVIVEFDREKDLKLNYKHSGELNQTQYKLTTAQLTKNKKIGFSHEFGIYRVVTPARVVDFENYISIDDEGLAGEMVYLHYKNRYYGPAKVVDVQDRNCIKFNYTAENYMIRYFNDSDVNEKYRLFDTDDYAIDEDVRMIYVYGDSEPDAEDMITDEILMKSLGGKVSTLDISDIDKYVMSSNSPYLKNCPQYIRSSRIERISSILQEKCDITDGFIKAFEKFLDGGSEKSKALLKKYGAAGDLDRASDGAGKRELEELKKLNREYFERIAWLEEKLDEYDEISRNEARLKEYAELDRLFSKKEGALSFLEERIDEKKRVLDGLDENYKEISLKVREAIDEGIKSAPKIAFEPLIANELISAASKWETGNEEELYGDYSKLLFNAELENVKKEEITDYICDRVQEYRANYSRNFIMNIMICMMQGFLTVFSGEPGIGKTSVCNIIARVLGLMKMNDALGNKTPDIVDSNRYVSVSVERGWSSKRDFIGYYNPLTKKFDASNKNVYNAFKLLDCEFEDGEDISKYPYLMLLDEANLSQMEYYWADFMNIADYDEDVKSINLGAGITTRIPKTFRFFATINNDQTTESLSPRLLDRAWMISLPVDDSSVLGYAAADAPHREVKPILWEDLYSVFGERHLSEVKNGEILESIYKVFKKHHVQISVRTKLAIERYLLTAQAVFEEEPDRPGKEYIAMDYAVMQKLLPKIDKYRITMLEELQSLAREYKLEMTDECITNTLADSAVDYTDLLN